MAGRTRTAGETGLRPDGPLLTLMMAAGASVWLLLRPESVMAIPVGWRIPLLLIGAWGLGAAFIRPLTLEMREAWPRRLAGARCSRWALWGFIFVLALLELRFSS